MSFGADYNRSILFVRNIKKLCQDALHIIGLKLL